jgi:tetratricopeptide (TPR) repeat protein
MGRNQNQPEFRERGKKSPMCNTVSGERPIQAAGGLRAVSSLSSSGFLAACLIVLVTIVSYCNSFSGPFVFDDGQSIVSNTTIHNLMAIDQILSPPAKGETVNGRPFLNLSFAINYAISGSEVWSYHLANLGIHVMAALFLLGILRHTFLLPSMRDRWGDVGPWLALGIAMFWAVHPMQTESVTYIVQRAESLVSLFYLLTLYCVIRGAEATGRMSSPDQGTFANAVSATVVPVGGSSARSMAWYTASILACFLGMASKEVMVSMPLMVLLYDRTFLTGAFREAWRRRYGLYFAMAATWGMLGWLVFAAHGRGGSAGFGSEIGWWQYLCTQFVAIVHYLRLSVCPYPLVFDYGILVVRNPLEIIPSAILVLSLGIATVIALWRWPKAGFLGACFFMILAPTSSFVPVATQTVAEHRMYLPLAAVITALVVGCFVLAERLPRRNHLSLRTTKILGIIAVIMTTVVLGCLTFRRNFDYQSILSIWQNTVRNAPANDRAEYNLGVAIISDEAISDVKDRYQKAIPHYLKAIEINPNGAEAFGNLGVALAFLGKNDEAIDAFEKALALNPKITTVHYNLGTTLADCKRTDEAISHLQQALDMDPDYIDAHYQLGKAWTVKEQMDKAIPEFQRVVELQPDRFGAYYNLAEALTKQSQFKEAAIQYRKAIEINPTFVEAMNNLAILLASCPDAAARNGADAVKIANRAVQLSRGQDPIILSTLAAAYAEAGQFPEAIQVAKNAHAMALSRNQIEVAKFIQDNLRLYEAKQPLHTSISSPSPP